MRHFWLAWLVLLIVASLVPRPGVAREDEISVNIIGGARDYKLALQRFASDAASRADVEPFFSETLAAIALSGGFQRVPDNAFLEPLQTVKLDSPRIPCDNWRAVGTDALVEGRIHQVGGNKRISYRVWDVARCQQQGQPAFFEVSSDDLWIAARKLADDVVYRFTGRRGISTTQIAFVSNDSATTFPS